MYRVITVKGIGEAPCCRPYAAIQSSSIVGLASRDDLQVLSVSVVIFPCDMGRVNNIDLRILEAYPTKIILR